MTGPLLAALRKTSFRNKVTWLATMTSSLAVILLSVLLSAINYADLDRESRTLATSRARLVAINSEAPLAFDDRELATEALSALRAAPEVASASLFDPQGNRFAQYRRPKDAGPTFSPGRGSSEHGRWLVVHLPVGDQSPASGTVQLVYDRSGMWERFVAGLVVALGVIIGAMLLSFLVGRRISQRLVKPIDELAQTAHRISRSKNYALRAVKLGNDELGALTDAFNEMLDQIQQQEQELAAAHAAREGLLDAERSARAELERASQLKDEFVATLSHELRTPLTPILGWVEVLKRKNSPDPQLAQGLEVIERNARMQTQIIEDLLDMSRIVSGKVRLNILPVNLTEVIEAGIATVKPAAEAREIELVMSLDTSAGLIRGDPGRLQQIIWNLLTNAIKFTPRGGRVQISLLRGNANMVIEVSDTGQGIAPSFLPHIFERFRQADSSTTRNHGGLGLGLAIVKQLVELHGGSIGVYSSGKGLGTTFTVLLPMAGMQQVEHTRSPASVPPTRALTSTPRQTTVLDGLCVLVVDDDEDARTLIATVLEERRACVVVSDSAEHALPLLQSARPQVLISDIGMPGMDGYELMRHIRGLPDALGGSTPGIALTAFAGSEDRRRALHAGYQLHLAKPVQPTELIDALARIVEQAGDRPRSHSSHSKSVAD